MPSKLKMRQPRRITSMMKNSARSMGYLVSDVFREMNPVIAELYDDNKETASNLYKSIRDFNPTFGNTNSLKQELNETTKAIFKNFTDDLKSGNWYNKARQDKVVDVMGMMGFDEKDFDFDFDDDWGDFDDFDSDSSDFDEGTAAVIEDNKKSTQQIISSVDRTGYAIASTVNQGQMQSAGMIVEASNQQTQALYSLNQRGFQSVTEALLGINQSLTAIGQLGEPLTVHVQNSGVFYTKTTEQLTSINEKLDQLIKNTTIGTSNGNGTSTSKKNSSFADLLGGEDLFNASSYMDAIKENFKDDKDFLDMAKGAFKHINLKNISPGVMISRFITGAIIPKMFKDTMSTFNETIKYTINDLFLKGTYKLQNSNSLLLSLISDYFVPKNTFGKLRSFDTSKYEKGPIQWDGVAKKALTEVIPTTLFKILSALDGKPEQRYDYNSGKFVSVSSARKSLDDMKSRYAREAGGDLRSAVISDIDKDFAGKRDNPEYARLMKETEKFFIKEVLESDDPFTLARLLSPQAATYFKDIDPGVLKKLIKIVKDKDNKVMLQKFTTQKFKGRNSYNAAMDKESQDPMSLLVHMFNGSVDPSAFDTKGKRKVSPILVDEYSNTLFDYLRGMSKDIKYIAAAMAVTVGNKKDAKKIMNGKGKKIKGIRFDSSLSFVTEHDGERTTQEIDRSNRSRDLINAENQLGLSEQAILDAENRNKGFKERFGEVKDKIYDYFESKGIGIKSVTQAPFYAASNLLTKLSDAMTKVIIGDPNDPESGLLGKITTKAGELFDSLKDKLRELFDTGLKDTFDKLFGEKDENGERHGGFFSDFYNETRTSLRSGFDYVKNTASEYAWGKAKARRDEHNATIASLRQTAAEHRERYNALKAQEEEDTGGSGSGLLALISGGRSRKSERKARRKEMVSLRQQIEEAEAAMSDEKKARRSDVLKEAETGDAGLIGNTIGQLYRFGKNMKAANEMMMGKEKSDDIVGAFSNLKDDLIKGKGNIGAGAIVGMGAGALLGAPLLGAVAGSAVGFIKSSKTAQDFLFGELDEKTGERSGGMLGDNFKDFLDKEGFKKTGASAAIGGTIGLFMGSPVMGAIVGGSIGFVKSSETAQEFLFGSKDENGNRVDDGIIPQSIVDSFKNKKALAGLLGAGAGIGALMGGPLGLVGGLTVGAAINHFNTSEKFRTMLFGDEKGEGGLLSDFKKNILDNIKERMFNTGNAIKGWLKVTGRNITASLNKGIKEKIFGPIGERLRRFVDKRFGAAAADKLKNFGGGLLAGISGLTVDRANKRMAKNISKGYNVYSKDYNRNMTSAEILDTMGNRDLAKYFGKGKKGEQAAQEYMAQYEAFANMSKGERMGAREELLNIYNTSTDKKERNRAFALADQLSLDQKMADKLVKEHPELKPLDSINTTVKDIFDVMIKGKKKFIKDKGIVTGGFVTEEMSEAADVETGKKKGHEVVQTLFGPMKMKRNEQGDPEPDTSDSETVEALKEKKTFSSAMKQIPVIGGVLGGLGGFLGKLKDKLFGKDDDEKKPGLLDMLGNVLGGIGGLFGGLGKGIGGIGKGIGGALKGAGAFAKNGGLFNLFKGVIGPALLAAGFAGAFDGLGKKIGELKPFKGNDTKSTLSDDNTYMVNGQVIQKDDNGKPIQNENGEYLTVDGEWVSGELSNIGQSNSVSSNMKRNLVTRAVYSKGKEFGLASKVFKSSKKNLGKAKSKWKEAFGKTAKKAAEEDVDDAAMRALEEANGVKVKKKSIVSKAFDKAKGKAAGIKGKFSAKTAEKAAEKAAKDATKSALTSNLKLHITEGLEKVGKALKKVLFFPKKIASNFPKIIPELGENIFKKAGPKLITKIGANAAKFIPIAGQILYVGTIIAAGVNAWGNAESILGITQKATKSQRAIATMIACINNAIPIIGGLIPNKVLVNIFMTLAPKLGLDVTELQKQREQATKEVEAYNEKHGTDLSIEEYNKLNGKAGVFTKLGDKIKAKFNSKETKDNLNGIKESYSKTFAALKAGDVKGIWAKDDKEDPNQPISGFAKNINLIGKIIATPITGIVWAGKKIGEGIGKVVNPIRDGISVFKQEMDKGNQLFANPKADMSDFLDLSNYPNSDMSPIFKAIVVGARLSSIPIALVKATGKKIGKKIDKITDTVADTFNAMKSNEESIDKYADAGDIKGLLGLKYEESEDADNAVGVIAKLDFFNRKVTHLPIAFFKSIGNSVKGIYDKMLENEPTRKNAEVVGKAVEQIKQFANNGDISSIWGVRVTLDETDPMHTMWNFSLNITKLASSMSGVIHTIGNGIGGLWDKLKEKIGIAGEKAGNSVLDSAREYVNSAYDDEEDEDYEEESGSGSGFISQYNRRMANKKMVGGSFASKGCGPSVAAMAASANGVNLDVDNALNDSKRYQNDYGVTLDYFGNTLGKRGIKTRFISGGGTADIYRSIASGHPTILLGKDPYNDSKANSPFGPNNHYVLARGLDRNGNVIINDPEMSGPTTYSPSILNSTSYAMATSGGGSNMSNIWGYLKSKGFNDYAIAGLMGCWQNESGNKPDRLEGDYALHPNVSKVLKNNKTMNEYAKKVFKLHHVTTGQKWYKGTDGNYYPGYGLAQWTGPRHQAVMNWAKKNNKDYKKLRTQLDYTWAEINKRPTYKKRAKAASSVKEGVIAALDQFENSSDSYHTNNPTLYNNRLKAGKTIYNKFKGKRGTMPGDAGTAGTDSSGTAETGAVNESDGILGKVSSAFTSGFAKLLGGSAEAPTTTGVSTDSDSSDDTEGGTNTEKWISTVKKIKKAVAAQKPNYQDPMYRTIKIDGKKYKYRADCSGLVDLYLHHLNLLDKNMQPATGWYMGGGKPSGFKRMKFPGWNKLKKGDILMNSQHTEVFSHNEKNGLHRVWNGGSSKSLQSPGPTYSGHSTYNYIYRRKESGSGSGLTNAGMALANIGGSHNYSNFSGGASAINTKKTALSDSMSLDSYVSAVRTKVANGQISMETVAQLLSAITKILENIANNTSSGDKIYALLQDYTSQVADFKESASNSGAGSGATNRNVNKHKNSTKGHGGNVNSGNVDQNFKNLLKSLAEIATG